MPVVIIGEARTLDAMPESIVVSCELAKQISVNSVREKRGLQRRAA